MDDDIAALESRIATLETTAQLTLALLHELTAMIRSQQDQLKHLSALVVQETPQPGCKPKLYVVKRDNNENSQDS